MSQKFLLTVFIYLIISIVYTFGQDSIYEFESITTEDGLPSNSINAVTKDSLGFIWIATSNGLCRYNDKNQITIFQADHSSPDFLKSNIIRALYTDKNGILYIGTRYGGLTILNPFDYTWKTFRHIPGDASSINNNEVLAITEDNKGNILIGTEVGFNVFNPQTETFTSFSLNPSGSTSQKGKPVVSIFKDSQEKIWVGTWSFGLYMFEPDYQNLAQSVFTPIPLADEVVRPCIWSIYEDHLNNIWLGGENEVFVVDEHANIEQILKHSKKWSKHAYLNHQKVGRVHGIAQDTDKNVWLATTDGAYILHLHNPLNKQYQSPIKTVNHIAYVHSQNKKIAHDFINSVYKDDIGNIWLSTYKGLSINKYNFYQPEQYQLDIVGHNGTFLNDSIYLNMENKHEIFSYNIIQKTKSKLSPSPLINAANPIKTISTTKDKQLIIICSKNIFIYDLTTKKITCNYAISQKEQSTFALLQDRAIKLVNNNLWIGTTLNGIFTLNIQTLQGAWHRQNINVDNALVDNGISHLELDNNNNLWISSYGGISVVDSHSLSQYDGTNKISFTNYTVNSSNQGLTTNRISYLKNGANNMWIGTTHGLIMYDYEQNRFKDLGSTKYKPWIEFIEYTHEDNIWMGTTEGILCYQPSTSTYINYNEQLDATNLSFYYSDAFKTSDDYLIFNNDKKVLYFNPENIAQQSPDFPLHIFSAKTINSKSEKKNYNLLKNHKLELKSNDYYLSIDFAHLNYDHKSHKKYAYKLDGLEKEWQYLEKNTPAVYTNLNHGKYTFQVKSQKENGKWMLASNPITIVKHPAFWQTWSFKLGLPLVALLLIALYLRNLSLRNRKMISINEKLNFQITQRQKTEATLRLKNQELSKEIGERERIEEILQHKNTELKRSNRDLQEFAYIASHDLQSPLVTIISFAGLLKKKLKSKLTSEEEEYFNFIFSSSKRMRNLIVDILSYSRINADKININKIDIGNILSQIKADLDTIIQQSEATIVLGDLPEYIYGDELKIKQLFQNLISNAIKYRKKELAPIVKIESYEENNHWIFTISDNGIGIKKEYQNVIFTIFQRLHNNDEQYEGTGIGLSICRKIIDQHKGDISLSSEVGVGTTFFLKLPKSLETEMLNQSEQQETLIASAR